MVAGIEGYTDNITITSIVGRFLEHSRIYIFGKGKTAKIYISSADFMTRNTIRRVEVATPVYDDGIKERILRMFNTMLCDNVKARIMAIIRRMRLTEYQGSIRRNIFMMRL